MQAFENESGAKFIILKSDNGGEFVKNELEPWIKNKELKIIQVPEDSGVKLSGRAIQSKYSGIIQNYAPFILVGAQFMG